MRKSKFVWRAANENRRARIRRLLESEGSQDIVSDKFIDWILKLKERREDTSARVLLATLPLYLFFALDLLSPAFKVPLLGAQVDNLPGLREGVVFCMASLWVVAGLQTTEVNYIDMFVEEIMRKRFGPLSKEFSHLFTANHWTGAYKSIDPPDAYMFRTSAHMAFGLVLISSLGVLLALFFVVVTVLYFGAIFRVVTAPGLPWPWSYCIAGYATASVVFNSLVSMSENAKLPFRDYTAIMAIAARINPELAKRARSSHAMD